MATKGYVDNTTPSKTHTHVSKDIIDAVSTFQQDYSNAEKLVKHNGGGRISAPEPYYSYEVATLGTVRSFVEENCVSVQTYEYPPALTSSTSKSARFYFFSNEPTIRKVVVIGEVWDSYLAQTDIWINVVPTMHDENIEAKRQTVSIHSSRTGSAFSAEFMLLPDEWCNGLYVYASDEDTGIQELLRSTTVTTKTLRF
mgnify:FL=1